MPSSLAILACADCGRAATERHGVTLRCECGSRKFEPDAEAEARANYRRAIQTTAALRDLLAAIDAAGDLPWRVLVAAEDARRVIA